MVTLFSQLHMVTIIPKEELALHCVIELLGLKEAMWMIFSYIPITADLLQMPVLNNLKERQPFQESLVAKN